MQKSCLILGRGLHLRWREVCYIWYIFPWKFSHLPFCFFASEMFKFNVEFGTQSWRNIIFCSAPVSVFNLAELMQFICMIKESFSEWNVFRFFAIQIFMRFFQHAKKLLLRCIIRPALFSTFYVQPSADFSDITRNLPGNVLLFENF